ncbi:MAG: ferrous iron transport protein A [Burkholderiales bacterium]|nr:ferrous iron transport protein A [Burkholderiales bacterium]
MLDPHLVAGNASANSAATQRQASLADIAIGEPCIVRQLIAPAAMPEWSTQLEDIGFIAGEPVTLMARGAFGGDPLVIRIGLSTFALRKAEAACVLVDVLAANNDATGSATKPVNKVAA